MFADDYIMRQIEGLSRMLARVLFDRDMESEELHLDEDGTLSGSDVLAYRLKKLLHERKINEAENLLFETLEASPLPSYGRTALDFYREISTLSDEELAAADFSREEIADGLREVQRLLELPPEVE
jgi:hypothetical protein